MSTHCTITCFGFRATRADGVSVVYFRFTHLLNRPRYVGDVYLYLYNERTEVRVTVRVIDFLTCVVRGMMMKARKKVELGAGT